MAGLFFPVMTLLLVSSCYPGPALAADFKNCGNDKSLGHFTSIVVSNCTSEDDKCPLHRGHNATIAIDFETKEEVKSVVQSVHGVIASVPVPFPMKEDACSDTGLTCPLTVGAHHYQYSIFVRKAYPKLSVDVKWELLNESGTQIICVIIPSIIK